MRIHLGCIYISQFSPLPVRNMSCVKKAANVYRDDPPVRNLGLFLFRPCLPVIGPSSSSSLHSSCDAGEGTVVVFEGRAESLRGMRSSSEAPQAMMGGAETMSGIDPNGRKSADSKAS